MQLVLRAAAAYWILLFAVRLIGRRTASQMARFDLVVLFLFAGITITAVLADDHSMVGAFSGICTIGLMNILASWLKSYSDWFGRIIDGTPVVVFEHGEFNARRMSRLRLKRAGHHGRSSPARADAAAAGAVRDGRTRRQDLHPPGTRHEPSRNHHRHPGSDRSAALEPVPTCWFSWRWE